MARAALSKSYNGTFYSAEILEKLIQVIFTVLNDSLLWHLALLFYVHLVQRWETSLSLSNIFRISPVTTGSKLCPWARHINSLIALLTDYWLIPRKHCFHPTLSEKLLPWMLYQKQQQNIYYIIK